MTEAEDREAAIKAEFPGWAIWHGVASLCYASRRFGLSTVVVRAHNWTALAERIRAKEAALAGGAATPDRSGPGGA